MRPFFKIAKKRRTIDAKNKISKRCIYPHDVLSDGLCHDLLQHFHEHRRNDKSVFLMAFHEMIIMWPAAFILEFFLVDHLAHKLAFCMVTPQDRPIVITLAISIMIIAIMCPIMSFIATLLFKNAGKEFVAVWLQTTFLNFPVAFFWQLMYCGPFIRFLFRKLFPEK